MSEQLTTRRELDLISYSNAFNNLSLSDAIVLWECFPVDTIERKVIGLRYGLYGVPSLSALETVDNLKRVNHLSLSFQVVRDFELLALKIMLHQII